MDWYEWSTSWAVDEPKKSKSLVGVQVIDAFFVTFSYFGPGAWLLYIVISIIWLPTKNTSIFLV